MVISLVVMGGVGIGDNRIAHWLAQGQQTLKTSTTGDLSFVIASITVVMLPDGEARG